MLRELIYTGLGASSLLRNKIKDEVEILQKNGKLKKKDAKSFLEGLEKTGRDEDKKIKKHLKKLLRKSINELGLVTKKDLKKLKAEIRKEKINDKVTSDEEIRNEEVK